MFDSNLKQVTGNVAHDAADSGQPVKVGGKAATSAPSAVSAGDRVDAYFDANGRLVVALDELQKAEDAAHSSGDKGVMALAVRKDTAAVLSGTDGDYNPLIVDAKGRLHAAIYNKQFTLSLTPDAPTPTGTDIVMETGSAVAEADLRIRNTSAHRFYVPMDGYRSIAIYAKVGVTFDSGASTVSVKVWGAYDRVSGAVPVGALLGTWVINRNAGMRFDISTSEAGALGAYTEASDPPDNNVHYHVPALSDGFPYIVVEFICSVAPTSVGEINPLIICRTTG